MPHRSARLLVAASALAASAVACSSEHAGDDASAEPSASTESALGRESLTPAQQACFDDIYPTTSLSRDQVLRLCRPTSWAISERSEGSTQPQPSILAK